MFPKKLYKIVKCEIEELDFIRVISNLNGIPSDEEAIYSNLQIPNNACIIFRNSGDFYTEYSTNNERLWESKDKAIQMIKLSKNYTTKKSKEDKNDNTLDKKSRK